ncbi:ATP-dependent DNA helicase [Kineococcus xinjiangensis]|uniref:ATP-dependent helicase n=1 Tax=Kineococcus xinjiangensis TaxID=512762 RepID=UPI001B80ABA6|nr:ATP-dependent DNA helicase [Kineococcus xinjiangensis]
MKLQHPGAPAASLPRVPRLLRRPALAPRDLLLDPSQERVVAARTGSGPLVVLSAPGTGATTTLVEAVAARVERDGTDPDAVLVLAPSRRAAGALRDRITDRLRRTMAEPAARTPQSYAFGLLRRVRAAAGDPPPRLITGAEQDLVLAELLRGHQAGADPGWPADVPREAWTLRTFRTELRDLLMRATERGLTPADLDELGRRHSRPEWLAAARAMQEYLDVNALGRADGYDPAGVVDEATEHLRTSPELLRAERERWRLVVVDDAHDVSEAGFRLLDELCGGGRDLLLFADPDAVTEGFRGADARTVAELPTRYHRADGRPAGTVVLSTAWRQAPRLRAATGRVAVRIGAVGGGVHRNPAPRPATPAAGPAATAASGGDGGRVEAVVLSSPTQEAAWIAQRLRSRHLLAGVPWDEMAVLVRSGGSTDALRRGLAAAGVPLTVPLAEMPVRDEPAVRPLCTALQVVLRPEALDAEAARELVTSALGGADVVGLRRLRQALRREERAGGGNRSSDVVLAAVLADPVGLVALPDPALRPAHRVAAVLQAGRSAARARDASAESVLWAMWEASGLAPRWQRAALAGGRDGARADRDLDAVVALFEAAGRFVDRFPGTGSALRFLDQLQAEEVPTDTLAERAPATGAVTLTTPQGAVGREWDLVVVAGVQEGAWPDLRLRGSVLGAQALVDLVAGRPADGRGARRAVLEDELRLFHVAVSRARSELLVTSVRTEDERPSPFLDLVDPPGDEEGERPLAEVPRAVSLPALVARLRQVVCAPAPVEGPRRRAAAALVLARLARAGVPGAWPDDWYGVSPLSDPRPLREAGEEVVVSPSRVGLFEDCPLRWLLESVGGTPADSTGQSVGSLVHQVASEAPAAGAEELRARLDEAWPSLGLAPGWISDATRRRADEMVVKLAEYHRLAGREGRELVAVEQDFSVGVGRARLRGRVDRLERDAQGRLVVVDLKTGGSKPRKDELARHAQLGVYQLAAEQGSFGDVGSGSGGAALVQLGTGEKRGVSVQAQAPLAEDADPRWVGDLLERTADGMAAAQFEAVAGTHCRTCPVRGSCPVQEEGRSVVDTGEEAAP